ncbi:hypothetical protein G6F63_016177 [Rhizopus arrhizus]|nr:hypothetical protein G6F63_016177 [Rhizopus arrhizus]
MGGRRRYRLGGQGNKQRRCAQDRGRRYPDHHRDAGGDAADERQGHRGDAGGGADDRRDRVLRRQALPAYQPRHPGRHGHDGADRRAVAGRAAGSEGARHPAA